MKNGGTLIKNEQKVCDFCKSEKLFWPDLIEASNMPKDNPCPFPKGNYSIKNFILDGSKFATPPGKYVAQWSIVEDGEVLTSMKIDVTASL